MAFQNAMSRSSVDVAGLTSWRSNWAGLRVAVFGLGVTGFAAADTLAELGAEVLVLAASADPERADLLSVIGAGLATVELVERFDEFAADLVVVSPGFRPAHPLVRRAREVGIPVWGDVELAWRVRDKIEPAAEWIAITGTNGKTTTTQLATAMLAAGGKRVAACGNVGVPVLDAIRDPIGFDVLVVELSSFQLHYLESMSAHSAACLNLADDHIDWHGSAAEYRSAKGRVFERAKIACVYNFEDEVTRGLVEEAAVVEGCRAIGFGLGLPGPGDVGLVSEILVDRAFLDDRQRTALELATVLDLEKVGLGSPHMIANVLAAAALARSFGVPIEAVRAAILAFRLDHHRTETIVLTAGVRWVDDSKATNPHAAQAALDSFRPVIWIVGGQLKGVSIDDLVSRNVQRVKAAVIIGVDRAALVEAFARHAPELPVFEVATTQTNEVMPTAVRLSSSIAVAGDTVLLAPAAASMDQFTDYADRGDRFARAVRDLLGGLNDNEHSPTAPAV